MNFRTRRPEKPYLTWAPMAGVLLFSPLNVKSHLTINGVCALRGLESGGFITEKGAHETIWLGLARETSR
jgi:hypothetical protein